MPKRYLGNIITDTPTEPTNNYEDTAVPGVWSLAEAFAYTKAGLWPTQGNANTRMVIQLGRPAGTLTSVMESIQIPILSNSVDFGDIVGADADKAYRNASGSSSTRGVIAGGASNNNDIQYSTIATGGNTQSFGDLTLGREYLRGCSNDTKAVFAGGETNGVRDTGDQVTIATTGNATNFGDLRTRVWKHASCASTTRGIMAGGVNSSSTVINEIQYYTFASGGTSVDFGDLTEVKSQNAGASNATRGIFSGRSQATDTYDYITIASTGNATDFGNMRLGPINDLMASASPTRAVWAGGNEDSTGTDIYTRIEYVEIATTGNGQNFGNLSNGGGFGTAFSNGHGGI